MGKKLILKGCPKCKGDLGRTGEMRFLRRVDNIVKARVEYACVQCGRTLELEQIVDRSDLTKYNT